MYKLKNKKRLTLLVTVFMLVFVIGAAFASNDGILDIRGTVTINEPELLVIWTEPIALEPLFAFGDVTTNDAVRVTYRGRDYQRILWEVEFDGPGWATMITSAYNAGSLDAIIEPNASAYTWSVAVPPGLTVDFTDTISGPLAVGATSAPLTVTVEWDGDAGPNPEDFFTNGTFSAILAIDFDYIVAP